MYTGDFKLEDFQKDDKTFEEERKKYSSSSNIMSNKIVIKEGKEGIRAKKLRLQGQDLEKYRDDNEGMVENWKALSVPKEAFHRVSSEESSEKIQQSQKDMARDLDMIRAERREALKSMVINIVITLVFIILCFAQVIGILKLDEIVFLNIDNEYAVYGLYALIHAGIPILVFRLTRVAEQALGEHYIRIWHQIFFMAASLTAALLMFGNMMSSTIGMAVAGVCQILVILLTLFPKYSD